MTLANAASATLSPSDSPSAQTTAQTVAPALASLSTTLTATHALAAYQRLSGNERLDFMQTIYSRSGESITNRVVGAEWSSLAHRLSSKVGQVSRTDRTGVIKDILTNQDTRFSRAYGELDTNTRLAFWHRLVRSLNPYGHHHRFPSTAVQDLVTQTERLSADQQFAFLSEAVDQMGV